MPDVVDRLVAALNAHDMQACLRCYSDAATMVGPEMQADGHEQIASYHAHVWDAVPDVSMTVWDRISQGDRAAVETTFHGTHTGPFLIAGGQVVEPSGRRVSFHACWVFTIENDLIIAHRLYFDQLELYTQLGVAFPSTAS